jgi:type IV pilus assembly protein PilC
MPRFTPMFESRGELLPKPTRVMMAISAQLIDHWKWWAAGLVVALVAIVRGKRTEIGGRVMDWLKIHIPIIGPVIRKVILSRSIRTLGTMMASGVSVLEAIRLSADVSGNYYYLRIWNQVLDRVTSGSRIHEVLAGEPLFPGVLVQMIRSGEDSGKLDVVLEKVSAYYDNEVDLSIKSATSLIEPLLILVMGVVVGTIGLSILLPIFSLSRPAAG